MQNTTNYALPTWEKDDQIKMSDFNAMTAKLDAALKSNADAVASEVTARETAVSAEAAARGALAKNLGAAGHNARVAFGTYTGQDRGGQSNPVVFNCPFYPVLLFVKQVAALGSGGGNYPALFLRGSGFSKPSSDNTVGSNATMYVEWADSSVTWYLKDSTAPWSQFDDADATYLYALVGYDKSAEEA